MQGVYSVLATPFRQGGDVDVESLKTYVEHFIGAGVSGFTALGVLGEAARYVEPKANELGVEVAFGAVSRGVAEVDRSLLSQVLMNLSLNAVEAAGSLDQTAVRDAMRALDAKTVFGPIKFDATGYNLALKYPYVVQWHGDDLVVAGAAEVGREGDSPRAVELHEDPAP